MGCFSVLLLVVGSEVKATCSSFALLPSFSFEGWMFMLCCVVEFNRFKESIKTIMT